MVRNIKKKGPQHFLLSSRAKTLSLRDLMDMTPEKVEHTFREVRWPETAGMPVCPACGDLDAYECRRPNGALRFRCKACGKDFTVTSGTLFASHKLSLRVYLMAIVIFCNEVKGKSMLALSRDLGTAYKTAFVLAHKLREAISADLKGREFGGEGSVVEIDGAYFGGYVKPHNRRPRRKDRRKKENRNGKRKCVVVIRERNGLTLPNVFLSEGAAITWLKRKIKFHVKIHADEGKAWEILHQTYEMRRVNHTEAYSTFEACTNWAESYFSRLRRAEIGHHHHIAGPYLIRYAQEMSWREDNRKRSNGALVRMVAGNAMRAKPSVDWSGYWQRRKLGMGQ